MRIWSVTKINFIMRLGFSRAFSGHLIITIKLKYHWKRIFIQNIYLFWHWAIIAYFTYHFIYSNNWFCKCSYHINCVYTMKKYCCHSTLKCWNCQRFDSFLILQLMHTSLHVCRLRLQISDYGKAQGTLLRSTSLEFGLCWLGEFVYISHKFLLEYTTNAWTALINFTVNGPSDHCLVESSLQL